MLKFAEPYNRIDKEKDFATLLSREKLRFNPIDHRFLQVGRSNGNSGWSLYLSASIAEVEDMIKTVLSALKRHNVSFRIPATLTAAKNILNGNFGAEHIGKVTTVFPIPTSEVVTLAKTLIQLTHRCNGPSIYNAIYLGGSVYTQFSSFTPRESYPMPANCRESWPFSDFIPAPSPISAMILWNRYV
ncbi:hypothetical protein KK062_30030, partial [Fulvivirgaceae bacterium PWU5]